MLEGLGGTAGDAGHRIDAGSPHPVLEIATALRLRPGERRDLWFRFGRADHVPASRPLALLARSRRTLAARLPRARAKAREAAREIPWHAAMLTGGLAVDRVLGDLTLDQASTYSNGDLPYALDGARRPTNLLFRPSDANLWALWLAAEYAAATGDLAAFDVPLAYHPSRATPAVPLRDHLRRQFRFFVARSDAASAATCAS